MKYDLPYLLRPDGNAGSVAFYRQWFADAWQAAGGGVVENLPVHPKIRSILARLMPFRIPRSFHAPLIVLGVSRMQSVAWPWCCFREVVPVVWDIWPRVRSDLVRFIKRFGVRRIFCTSSQTAQWLGETLPGLRAIWLPEGINVAAYPCGGKLVDRRVDVLSYGRQMPGFINEIRSSQLSKCKLNLRNGSEHLFKDFDGLTCGLRESKISICYPHCDTAPDYAGNVETLTQRYWEAMLSGTLLAGRAPKELVSLCGYDPCIELGDKPCVKLAEIIRNIGQYQWLADKNRLTALEKAGWDKRMSIIMESFA